MRDARHFAIFAIITVLVLGSGTSVCSSNQQGRTSTDHHEHGQIVVSADRMIKLIDLQGGEPVVLPKPSEVYGVASPAWSPDGSQLVFTGSSGGGLPDEHGTPIFRSNADGSGLIRLTPLGSHDQQPRWSPDGTQIIFIRLADDSRRLFLMNADGSSARPLLGDQFREYIQSDPAWSPDGRHVAFTAIEPDGPALIYVARADGAEARVLFDPEDHLDFVVLPGSSAPIWSPDGSQVAFVSYAYTGDAEIVVINADGTDLRNVSNGYLNDYDPAWSPDGQRIAFISTRDGVREQVYTVKPDGTDIQQLTTHLGEKRHPTWSPDGNEIAFTSNPSDIVVVHCGWEWQLQSITADGSHLETLLDDVLCESAPGWRPSIALDLGAAPAFHEVWARTDQPVVEGVVDRAWIWGPEPLTGIMTEPYAEASDGSRHVIYYDKSRMETNNPNANPDELWYVTNGLLVVEMIEGKIQIGDASFRAAEPANIPVAGDPDNPFGPTYAALAQRLDGPARDQNELITDRIDRNGKITNDPALSDYGIGIGTYVPETDHTVAAPFWEFVNSSGTIYEDGDLTNGSLFRNAFYGIGYPIIEPVWSTAVIAGVEQDVLLQCFERRCLTYTPGNPEGWQVEAGNVGQHYYQWRYDEQVDHMQVIDTGTSEAAPVGTDGSYVDWMVPEGNAIYAASLANAAPFPVVTAPAHRFTCDLDAGVVIWDEADQTCGSGCSTLYGKRLDGGDPFIIAPGGRSERSEVVDSYGAIAYPWVVWLRFEEQTSALLARDIATLTAQDDNRGVLK